MSTYNDYFQILYSMDRDLLFFSTDEHRHLGIIDEKNQQLLGKLIKRVHQQIQYIKKYQQQNVIDANFFPLSSTTGNRYSLAHQQTIIHDFFQQKHTQQLYLKLKDVKNRYHEIIRHQQIRILENDMERYQQLQKIHSISSRLDVYDQVYEELHHLRRALASLCRNWRLDRIQQIVNTIVVSSSSSSSPLFCYISDHQSHYPPSTTVFGFLKRWSRHPSSSATAVTAKKKYSMAPLNIGNKQQHRHPHLLCANQEQGRNTILQIIRDFQHVFEENVRQNEERMYQLYARVFQHNVDPMLAHDIQHLYLSVLATSPPSLSSLTPSGISSVCSWTSDTTGALFFNTRHLGPIDFDDMIHLTGTTSPPQQQPSSPISLSSSKPAASSSSTGRKNGIKWINSIRKKWKQQQQQQQHGQSNCHTTSCQQYYFQKQPEIDLDGLVQRQQPWSVCLGQLSEHLLYVGQQYYTQWIQEINQCQENQIAPFQLATETMVSTYRALQIEHGYSILSRLCLQMESFGL